MRDLLLRVLIGVYMISSIGYTNGLVIQDLMNEVNNGTVDEVDPDLSAPIPSLSAGQIFCLPEEVYNPPTTVEGCRTTLNSFRNYTNYGKVQEFLKSSDDRLSKPRNPQRPPYFFRNPGVSDCAVGITSHLDNVPAWFSFKQARKAMQDIIEECQHSGGRGGGMPIGVDILKQRRVNAWMITAVGRPLTPADMAYLRGQSSTAASIETY